MSQHRVLNTLVFLPTYRCSAACKDCCFGSNPRVQGEIPIENILKYIDQAAATKTIKLIVFSGGEPFLLGEKLDTAIEYAYNKGLLTRIVTNSYWAYSEDGAYKRLKQLKDKGLTELNSSTGDFHQEFVPVRRVVNASLAAIRLNIMMCVMVESRLGREFTHTKMFSDERLVNILKDPEKTKLFKIVDSPWMGNYDSESIDAEQPYLLNRQNLHLRKGCTSVLSTLVVTPYEKLGSCCGLPREQIPELNAGDLNENTIIDLYEKALEDFVKIWLHVEGPEHILAWAAKKDPSIDWENKYAHQCDACRAIYHDPKVRNVIKKHYEEKIHNILLRFAVLDKAKVNDSWQRA